MSDVNDLLDEAVGSYEPRGDRHGVERRVQRRRRRRRLTAGVVALSVFAAAGSFAWTAFRPVEPTIGSTEWGTYILSDLEVSPHVEPRTGQVVPDQADVTFTTRWSANVFPGDHQCHLSVFDATGSQIGSLSFQRTALSQGNRHPLAVPVDGSIERASATGSCDPERLDVPIAYVISNEHLEHVDSGVAIVYAVEWPDGLAPGQYPSHQACAAAAWDADGQILQVSRFTLAAPEGTHDADIALARIGEGMEATVTCEPYTREDVFPDPKPPDEDTQVIDSPSVTATSDRYVIASGEQGDGSWELTLYRAEIKHPSGETATGWCLDLDAPSVNDRDMSTTTMAIICTMGEGPSWSGPIGAFSAYPGFADGQSLIYGEVSDEVARVDVLIGDGEPQQAMLVPAPEGTPAGLSYFAVLVPGSGEIEIVALDEDGQVLEVKGAGKVPAAR